MAETTACPKCHGRGTYVHPDMGSLICDCRDLWTNMGASLAHLPHPAVAEAARLRAELAAAKAETEAERRQAQKWLAASRSVTDGTMDELGAALAELAAARGRVRELEAEVSAQVEAQGAIAEILREARAERDAALAKVDTQGKAPAVAGGAENGP